MQTHLNELRGVRDQILPLAAYALAQHYSHSKWPQPLLEYLHRVATVAIEDCDGLFIMGDVLTVPEHRAAILKFCEYARLVYTIELEEFARQHLEKGVING